MGIDVYVLDFLLSQHQLCSQPYGDTLWLGRQGIHLAGQEELVAAVLQRRVPGWTPGHITDGAPFADALFHRLGSARIASMDMSPFEGADIIHDLNTPVPASQHEAFDTIFDGGTLEHIFNVPVALANVIAMLKPGGRFITVNGANNQLGHGFYQFSPELLWSFFRSQPGFKIDSIQLMPCHGIPLGIETDDPAVVNARQEIGSTLYSTYLLGAVRKGSMRTSQVMPPQQSDYSAAWAANATDALAQPIGQTRNPIARSIE